MIHVLCTGEFTYSRNKYIPYFWSYQEKAFKKYWWRLALHTDPDLISSSYIVYKVSRGLTV